MIAFPVVALGLQSSGFAPDALIHFVFWIWVNFLLYNYVLFVVCTYMYLLWRGPMQLDTIIQYSLVFHSCLYFPKWPVHTFFRSLHCLSECMNIPQDFLTIVVGRVHVHTHVQCSSFVLLEHMLWTCTCICGIHVHMYSTWCLYWLVQISLIMKNETCYFVHVQYI